MSWTEQAFMRRMLNDAILTSRLATFNGNPAIFPYLWIPPTDKSPDVIRLPYIITESDVSYVPSDYKGTALAPVIRDIRIYGFKAYGSKLVNDTAERVATLFRKDKVPLGDVMFPDASINLISCMANGPMNAPVDSVFIGRLVRVTALAEEL